MRLSLRVRDGTHSAVRYCVMDYLRMRKLMIMASSSVNK